MKKEADPSPEGPREETATLIRRLQETRKRLEELTGGEVDSGILPVAQEYSLKQAQEKLRQSDERFHRMFTAAGTGMAISTPDGRFLKVNSAYCQMLGYTEEELLTRNFAALTHRDDLALNLKLRDELLAGQRESFVMEKRYVKKSGEIVWTRHSVFSATHAAGGEIATLMVVAEDITERKRMEAALSECKGGHRSLFDNMLEGYVYCRLLYDEQGQARDYIYLATNAAFGPQTGLGNVIGKKVSEVVPGMHQASPEQLEIFSRVAATGRPEKFQTYAKALGIWFSVSAYSDEKEHFIAVFDNITERKRAEERLRESEKLLAQAEALGQIGSWERDLTNGHGARSDEFYRILGLDPAENITGLLDYEKFIYPEDLADFLRVRRAVLVGQEEREWEFRIIHTDRGVRDMHVRVGFERDEEGRAVRIYGTIMDITERRRSDEALRQSREELRALAQRIEFVREEQAVRIARELHDTMGQTLTMLKLNVLNLQRQLAHYTGAPTTIESRDALEMIQGALANVRDLCAELRPPVLDHLGLGPAIEILAARFQTRSGISCTVNAAADIPAIDMQSQLAAYRIVQELLTNVARHAGATEVRITLRAERRVVEIEVADDGRGIRATEITGIHSLGLLGMRERALAAGGRIIIEAGIGGGTIGRISLPIVQPGKI